MIDPVRARHEQLEFGAHTLKRAIRGLSPAQLAHVPSGFANSTATLVLHVAAVEVNVAAMMSGKEVPAELGSALLLDRYAPLPGVPIAAAEAGETDESLTAKLEEARRFLVEVLDELTDADLVRDLPFGEGRTMPLTFFLDLLPFHLASHYGQIQVIKRFL